MPVFEKGVRIKPHTLSLVFMGIYMMKLEITYLPMITTQILGSLIASDSGPQISGPTTIPKGLIQAKMSLRNSTSAVINNLHVKV